MIAMPAKAGCQRRTSGLGRWLVFNLVGGLGILVQLIVLVSLTRLFDWHYLPATVAAVEAAVLHNFMWHERWTWAERAGGGTAEALARLARFNLTNGAISLLGNSLLMMVLVGEFSLNSVCANLISIGICSLVNFFAGDRLVYINVAPRPGRPADGC